VEAANQGEDEMERALSAHLALFLIFVVVSAFTGILIYLGRLKRPTVLDVYRFLKPINTETILNMKLNSAPYVQPTRWHYAELKESLLEIRRCFSKLQFDLRLLIAWVSSQLHMELVEKPWEKDWAENPPSEAQRLIEQQELEKFTAGHRRLLAEACALQKYVFGRQLRVYLWLIFRSHWFLPFPIPDVANLTFTRRSGPFRAREGAQLLPFLYLKMAQAAVDLGELYDATGGVSGVRGCFEEVFMNFDSRSL
jgi:hypothetical protein